MRILQTRNTLVRGKADNAGNCECCGAPVKGDKAECTLCGVGTYTEAAIGFCDCGGRVYLDHFTNTCDGCYRDYNMDGQPLADRSQWGEETGETYTDLIGI